MKLPMKTQLYRTCHHARGWFILFAITFSAATAGHAAAAPAYLLTAQAHVSGVLEGTVRNAADKTAAPGTALTFRLQNAPAVNPLQTQSNPDGTWKLEVPAAWRARPAAMMTIEAGSGEGTTQQVFELRKIPLLDPPVATLWTGGPEVDEPESAFYSIGRTLNHYTRNPEAITRFHNWLAARKIDLDGLAARTPAPRDLRRILLQPERVPAAGWQWNRAGEWISSPAANRGPEHRIPLQVERAGMYRIWIRYLGHKDGTAVTHSTLFKKGLETGAPLLYEEFNTRPAGDAGPRWHNFMTELVAGEYTIVLGHVVRYYQAANYVPMLEHKVDCIYLTDEISADEPTAELLTRLDAGGLLQSVEKPLLDADAKRLSQRWQVRPVDWEGARGNESLFRFSYQFWREEMDALSFLDYTAPPRDPVRVDLPDYREPRRQIIFDPIWNMVGNPYYVRWQIGNLESDIDPTAKDSTFQWISPGRFPVVFGQWERSNGGLTADHAARWGLAMGSYNAPHPGKWNFWVQFKNINYFETFSVHAVTPDGSAAHWKRSERLYPGGRETWAKVGTVEVPEMNPAAITSHKALAAKGVFVEGGASRFVYMQGDWKQVGNGLNSTGVATISSRSALKADGDFRIHTRLTLTAEDKAGACLFFREGNGLRENIIYLDGKIDGPSFDASLTSGLSGQITAGKYFDLDLIRTGSILAIVLNGKEVGRATLKDKPVGQFGIRSGVTPLRVHDFKATGQLDDGLELANRVFMTVRLEEYINARTYRGVYALFVTDDAEYVPQGALVPKPSPGRYFRQLKAAGATPEDGYAMTAYTGIDGISQTWMPPANQITTALPVTMAPDTSQSANLRFRSARYEPVVLKIEPGPLKAGTRTFPGRVSWRVVAFAPFGAGREDWSPQMLLRRPFMVVPPLGAAHAWLTIDTTGVPPGNYTSAVRITSGDLAGKTAFPARMVTLQVKVCPVRIAPKQPILVHGWVNPPPGENYRLDWFKRFNVWQGALFSKAEMVKYGLKLQIWPQWNVDATEIKSKINEAAKLGLGYDDWMFSIADEPTGTTPAELVKYVEIAKLIRAANPKVQITMNPGEAAAAATFQILQPYVDLWNPYKLHLTYGPSGRDYLKKPWIWYTTPCYQDKSPGIASEMFEQIRSVLSQPGDCRGTAFFAPYYPWRDPWDTAYEHIKDVSTFLFPSRHGPVSAPVWEAVREARQHADLARMVRERAKPDDAVAKKLWENGSPAEIMTWLEAHR